MLAHDDLFLKSWQPMEDHEEDQWAGIEYTGYICYEPGRTLVMDYGPGEIIVESYDSEGHRLQRFEFSFNGKTICPSYADTGLKRRR